MQIRKTNVNLTENCVENEKGVFEVNKFQEMYQAKCKSPEEVAMYVKSGDVCACPTGLEEPTAICEAVAARAMKGELTGVVHHATLSVKGGPFMKPELKGFLGLLAVLVEKVSKKVSILIFLVITVQSLAIGQRYSLD